MSSWCESFSEPVRTQLHFISDGIARHHELKPLSKQIYWCNKTAFYNPLSQTIIKNIFLGGRPLFGSRKLV